VPIIILGTDAVLAASPATPVQLAHACLRAGFANVVPASWGDELIAAAVLRRLPNYGGGPVIQCSCPIVAHRLLSVGGDLRPVLLPLVPPPVAVARYVHSLAQPTRTRITYVGACPGAIDESIDIRMTPDALFAMLAERDIVLEDQPHVFESVLPPDRRRFRSQPGGVPSAEALWTELGSRTLVDVDGEDFITEVAQLLLTGKNVLIDTSTRLGCACSGAAGGVRHQRSAVVALEPPRSATPIVDEQVPIDLDLPVPAVSRTPVDVIAVPPLAAERPATPPGGNDVHPGSRFGTLPGASPPDSRAPRAGNHVNHAQPRSLLSAFPVARDVDGKSLPRAYVARRRSPKGLSLGLPSDDVVDSTPALPAKTEGVEALHLQAQGAESIESDSETREQDSTPAPALASDSVATPTPPPIAIVLEPAAPPVAIVPAPTSLPEATPEATPESASPPVAASAPATARSVAAAHKPDVAPAVSAHAPKQTPPWSISAPVSDVAPRESARPARPTVESPTTEPRPQTEGRRPTPTTGWTLSRGQLVGILIAITMIAISVSTVVAILVGRSATAPVAPIGR
jgi:hypothetical protein